jgi:hypothetical protein
MQITVKTLNGKQLPLTIEAEWTIRKVKEEIESHHQLKAETLKLIIYGKVIDNDDKTATDFAIKDGDFIVAMVQKPKPAPKVKVEEKKEEEPVAQAQPVAATNPPVEAKPAQQQQPAQAQAQPQPAAENQELPAEVEAAVNELMAISGKDRELCIRALAAAHNIPDVAFEFLMSGHIPEIPEGTGEDFGDEDMVEGDEEGEGDGLENLAQYNLDANTLQAIRTLVQNPSFPMIRQRMV